MSKVKDKLISEEESRAAILRGDKVEVPTDAMNTLSEWIDSTLNDGEGVSEEMEWDLIRLDMALSSVRTHL